MVVNKPIFVYGTLRPGLSNYCLVKGKTEREIPAWTKGALFPNKSWTYPFLVTDGPYRVVGDLFFIKEAYYKDVLKILDFLEGYDSDREERSFYLRKTITVETAEGSYEAWAYVCNLPNYHHAVLWDVPIVDWKQRQKVRDIDERAAHGA